jgi:signal transduction histidine kinase
MSEFFSRDPKFTALFGWLASLCLVFVIGWLDFVTGYEVTLMVFYGIPIVLAVWLCDKYVAFAIASVACAVWGWADIASGHQYFNAGLHAWEISVRCVYFFVVAIAGAAIKDQQHSARIRVFALEKSRRLEKRMTEIMEYEQQRIGRDLHDGLCQYLAAVTCAVSALKIDLARLGISDLEKKADQIETLLGESVNQARDLARGLVPVQMDEPGLAAALQELAASTSRRLGMECTFECAGESAFDCNGKATHLYRIAQEAIDNASKHGKAHSVELRLSANPTAMSISVADDGVGFSKPKEDVDGIGLSVMRYRADAVGGELEIEGRARGGTVVSCTIHAGDNA